MQKNQYLKGFLADKLPKMLFGVGIVFLLISLVGFVKDKHHFYFSYLTSYMFFLKITLGSMFLVLVQYLARGGWGVAVRRIPECLMKNVALMIAFFIPILFGLEHLYHWLDLAHVAHDHLLQIKQPYLNKTFFVIRTIGYFTIWYLISRYFFKKSTDQDHIGGLENTAEMQKYSAPSVALFGLSFTFASFDWLMSLEPHWFSTMFGVYTFANSVVAALCTITLLYLLLRRHGFLKEVVTVEHYHDLGKLTYGFVVFWAYVTFSQFFLIWYANIPEETVWFLSRSVGSWKTFMIVTAIGHFVIPLFLFMSRHVKRNLSLHALMVGMILVTCYMDIVTIVKPTVSPEGVHFDLIDLSTFVGIGAIYFAFFFTRLKEHFLIPIKDPRLTESLNLDNH